MEWQVILDKNRNSFGIPRACFSYPFDAVLKGSSLFNDTPIWKLLKYDEEGAFHVYEGEGITLYEPSTPGEDTFIFAKIRPNIWSSDHFNDYYVGWHGTIIDDALDSLCIRVVNKSSGKSYNGVLITRGCLDGMAESYLNSIEEPCPFIALSNLFLVSAITEEVIGNTFRYIGSCDEIWLERNMK